MYPIDVAMPQAGCCVVGGLEFGAGLLLGSISGRGHRPASGVRRQCFSQSDVLSHAWCQACVEPCLLGREGSILGWVIVSCIMP